MAEEIIFRVGVDTGDTSKDIESVGESLLSVDSGANQATKSLAEMKVRAEQLRLELQRLDKGAESIDKVTKELAELDAAIHVIQSGGLDLIPHIEQKPLDSIEKRFADIQKRVASGELTQRQLTKAVKEYQSIALQAGETSPIGQQAIAEAGELSDRIGDLSARVRVAGEDGAAMQAALQLGSTITAGYGALQGITALVGQESEELTQTLVKLQAVQTTLASIEQIRAALEAESALRIQATTIAQKLYTLAVGESTGALKIFRLALIATGIGAIIAGIILLVQNWDLLTGAINESSIATEGLNATMEDYKKGATDAISETKQVKVAFDLAREGVISKDEALKIYNDTLGDSFGKAKDLNEAEALYASKTDAYIKATALRAQAQALLSKAAEEQAAGLTAQFDDQVGFWDEQKAAIQRQFGFFESAQETLIEGQKKGVVEAKKNSAQRAEIFTKEAERLLKEAELAETANGIKSESEQKLADDRKKIADEAEKKRKEAADKAAQEEKKRAEESKRLQREITDATIAAIEDRETRERMALAEKHRREMEDLRAQYGERQELIRLLEEKQAIEQRNFEATQDDIRQAEIEAAKEKRKKDNLLEIQERSGLAKALLDITFKNAQDQKAIDDAVFESKRMLASNIAGVIGQLAGLAKEGSNTQKALALTEIAINTAVGFVNGLRIAQQSAAATGPGAAFAFPIFYAQQIGAVLAAAKQAKSILGSGASVSPPPTTSSGGAFSGGVTSSGQNQSGQSGIMGNQTSTQGDGVQVVLVTDSLKKVQKQVLQAESVATLGG